MSRRSRISIVVAAAALAVAVTSLHAPIPQPRSYHHFADQRGLLGMPNAWNVLTNVPLLFAGLLGLQVALRKNHPSRGSRALQHERLPYVVLFAGVALTFLGSSYYHWSPTNERLVWDRLPMTLGFMGLLAATIGERVGADAGIKLLVPLVAIGLISVLTWQGSEVLGRGDLRPYLLVQFGSLGAVLLLVAFFPSRYSRSGLLLIALCLYGSAKLLESYDREVFRLLGVISGHSLKHVVAAAAAGTLAVMLVVRTERPVPVRSERECSP